MGRDYSSSNGGAPPEGAPTASPSNPGGAGLVLSLELHSAASTVVIPTIRTVAADLAARADFDLDSIDDLRMAVDDLCAMLVRIAAADATLRCRFTVAPERIEVAAEIEVDDPAQQLSTRTFGWHVLECLADEVRAESLPGAAGQRARVCISLAKAAVTAQQS
ncbi:MAG: ATP-binding protein [Pseudonocardiaceae bacterium]